VGARVEGSLPDEWSQGFHNLISLFLINLPPQLEDAPDVYLVAMAALERLHRPGAAGAGAGVHLQPFPPAWAGGFPQLEQLGLHNLGLAGPLPPSWLKGGSFPSLLFL